MFIRKVYKIIDGNNPDKVIVFSAHYLKIEKCMFMYYEDYAPYMDEILESKKYTEKLAKVLTKIALENKHELLMIFQDMDREEYIFSLTYGNSNCPRVEEKINDSIENYRFMEEYMNSYDLEYNTQYEITIKKDIYQTTILNGEEV